MAARWDTGTQEDEVEIIAGYLSNGTVAGRSTHDHLRGVPAHWHAWLSSGLPVEARGAVGVRQRARLRQPFVPAVATRPARDGVISSVDETRCRATLAVDTNLSEQHAGVAERLEEGGREIMKRQTLRARAGPFEHSVVRGAVDCCLRLSQ